MLAMLRKDIYVMGRYAAVYAAVWLAMLAAYARLPDVDGSFLYAILPICSLTVTLNAISADQACRWDRFAAMTPLRPRTLVLEKYVFAYALLAVLGLLGAGAAWLCRRDRDGLVTMAVLTALAVDTALPLIYRYGRRKGGALLMALWGAVAAVILGTALADYAAIEAAFGWMEDAPALPLEVGAVLLGAVWLSFRLSVRFYTRRQRGWYG